MDTKAFQELSQQLNDLYLSIPKTEPQDLAELTARAKAILVELDSLLASAVGSFSTDQVAEVEQSLTTLKQSAEAACTYLQNALKDTGEELARLKRGQRRTGPINSLWWGWVLPKEVLLIAKNRLFSKRYLA